MTKPLAHPCRSATTDERPSVSVLIKAYNHAPYIRQTINSVLDQSFEDFEVIVTDDGSVDDTLQILNEFTDSRIRVEALLENKGISAAMNATIARARGRYFAIINSDDWMLPERLRKQVAFLDSRPNVSSVFGLPRIVDEKGLPTTGFNDFALPLTFPDFSRRTWLRQFFYQGNCLCAPTAMIRREAYDSTGKYDNRLANLQDLDMWIRMLLAGHNIHVLPEQLSAFRIRANNANASAPSQSTLLRSVYETTKILRHFAGVDDCLFEEIFGQDIGRFDMNDCSALRVADIARHNPGTAHRVFALDCLYEHASSTADLRRLRDWAGTLDVCNVLTIADLSRDLRQLGHTIESQHDGIRQRDDTISRLKEKIRRRDLTINDLHEDVRRRDHTIERLNEGIQQRDLNNADLCHANEHLKGELSRETAQGERLKAQLHNRNAAIAELQKELAATLASRQAMLNSLSWRATALVRSMEGTIKKVRNHGPSK
jgi:glycosyltransferase involved in cell wall biosynthesis